MRTHRNHVPFYLANMYSGLCSIDSNYYIDCMLLIYLCSFNYSHLPRRIIQDILNRQTIHQFGSYAKQQYPDNPELQQQLITQLQEQHFQQYIQQMMEQSSELFDGNVQSLTKNLVGDESNTVNELETRNDSISREETITQENTFDEEEDDSEEEEEEEEEETMNPANRSVSNASMWTRKDIDTFKDTIRTEGGDGILKVGHGEIATIRVPTHENGNCIFWEFATDSYDIGFGLLFEWNSTPGNQLSIHISESEDEDDEEGMLLNYYKICKY